MKTLDKAINNLEKNPLFQMSLGSKELFHSNFLSWIINEKNEKKFVNSFLNELLEISEGIKTIVEFPEREKMNIDLSFKVELYDNTQRLIIIENKVKSLPYKKQLDKYYAKVDKEQANNNKKKNTTNYEVSYFLLSLVRPDISILLDEVGNERWIRISYKKIADSINNALAKIVTPPSDLISFENLLKSYVDFVTQLHKIAEEDLIIKNIKHELFNYTNGVKRKKYQNLRLHDLYLKSKYQQISHRIKKALIAKFGEELDTNFNPLEKLGKNNKILPNINNGVSIKEGFTNSNGMIDLKYIPHTFKIDNTDIYYTFCLQLQGDHLRYALQFMGKFEGKTKKFVAKLIYKLAHTLSDSHEWLNLPKHVKIERSIFVTQKLLGKPQKSNDYDKERKFCKFGDSFLYKYHQISPNTNVESIIDLYVKIFTQLYTNKQYYIDALNKTIKLQV